MIRLSKDEEPVLDCEGEVMVDLLELADTYVVWYRSADLYTVRLITLNNDPTQKFFTSTTHAPDPLVALKGAFHNWSREQ